MDMHVGGHGSLNGGRQSGEDRRSTDTELGQIRRHDQKLEPARNTTWGAICVGARGSKPTIAEYQGGEK